jgi:hypothetical protein
MMPFHGSFLLATTVAWAFCAPLLSPSTLAAQTPSPTELVASAREAAREDRNVASAALFEQALRLAPDLRREVLREYADQLTYSGRPSAAVPLYREVLGWGPDAGEERRARMGLALALRWSGRLAASHREYQALLDSDPADVEARLGLAGADAERGRPDLAAASLARVLDLHPDHAGARELERELRRRARPVTRLDMHRSTQTDDLEISRLAIAQAVTLGAGLTTVELRYDRFDYRQPGAPASPVVVDRPGAYLRHRAGDHVELNVAARVERIEPGGTAASSRPLTFDAWLTGWPADGVRLDLSVNRTTLDDVRSLAEPVVATLGGLSADLTPDERTRLTARASWGRLSDGNERWWSQLEAERRVGTAPHVLLGFRATAMGFAEQLAGGYFDPSSYTSAVATARAWHGFRNRTWVNAGGSYGRENADPGGTRPLWTADARINHWVGSRVELEARIDRFSSQQLFALDQAPAGGWARTTAGVGVRVLW